MTSPLHLKTYAYTQFSVKALPGGQLTATPKMDISFNYTVTRKNERRVTLEIRIGTSKNEAFSYEVNIAMEGLIEINPEYPINDVEQIACINAISVLFSAARETLLTLTGRCVGGPLFLPTLNFKDLAQQTEHLKKQGKNSVAAG